MSQQQQNKETLNLISQGVHLKKVGAPPERKLPTTAEIDEAKMRAEIEGPEVDPESGPKAGDSRSMLYLIKDCDIKLKKCETKEPRLPKAQEIQEQKKLEEQK